MAKPDITEKEYAVMSRGKTSTILLDNLKPIFIELYEETLSRMKNTYRAGDATEANLKAEISGLCMIDDLEAKLVSRVNRGRRITEEFHNE